MIKLFISLLLVASATNIYAQCLTCNSFNEAFKNPEQVTAIKINSMQHDVVLTEIPADIVKFINLKTLWLSSHEIIKINNAVCKLDNLRSLSLADNKLTSLPDCIYEMKNLEEIILNDNLFSAKTKEVIKNNFAKTNPGVKVFFGL